MDQLHPVRTFDLHSTQRIHVVQGEIDEYSGKVQARAHTARHVVKCFKEISSNIEKLHRAEEKPKLDSARKLRFLYYIDPEFNETLKSARKKVQVHMDSTVP